MVIIVLHRDHKHFHHLDVRDFCAVLHHSVRTLGLSVVHALLTFFTYCRGSVLLFDGAANCAAMLSLGLLAKHFLDCHLGAITFSFS